MPELPEVETIRLYLESHLIGKVIQMIDIREPKQFQGDPKTVMGKKVVAVQRKGKVLTIALSDNLFLNLHFKLTGQLLFAEDGKKAIYPNAIPLAESNRMPGKTTRVIFEFNDGSALFYNDLRKFGWVKVSNTPLVPTAVDVLSSEFTPAYLHAVTEKRNVPIKPLLMNQEVIAGIGNIYASDSLFEAGINPERKAKSLTEEECQKLHAAILTVVKDSLAFHGSSSHDEAFISPDGTKGKYQNRFRVYHREGKPCHRCQTPILRIKQGGRSTFYCPICQK